ncbi:MAG: hypothetical protein Q4G59_01860 [Planctomycetia bacterium]|nr:hypothetical protein [Planctomycetia bacterium]
MINRIMYKIIACIWTASILLASSTENTLAQSLPDSCTTCDLTIGVSPVRLLGSARFQKLLMSDEWTKFYLAATEKLDKDCLGSKKWSSFARQLEKSYALTPPRINSIFDTAFGNCHEAWFCCDLDVRSLLPRFGDPAFMFVSDYSPTETKRLLASAFEAYEYVPRMSQSESVFALSKGDVLVWFVDSFDLLAGNNKKAFLIGRDPAKMSVFKDSFLQDIACQKRLSDGKGPFFTAKLTLAGLGHIREYFANLPKEDAAAAFAPGMIEVAKKTKEVSFTAEGIADRIVCVLKLSCSDEATAKDLELFVTKSKELLAKWSAQDQTKPLGRLGVFVLGQSKVTVEGTALTLRYESADQQGLQLLLECLTQWKKQLTP